MTDENQEYNPEELKEQARSAMQKDVSGTTTIKRIRTTTVGEAYQGDSPIGSEYENPEQRCIEVAADYEVEGTEVEITDIFPIPDNNLSWKNPQTKLGRFFLTYGDMPKEDMKVNVVMRSSGFLGFDY